MPEPTETKDAQEEAHGRLVSGVVLPEEPGIEELARDWTLSAADIGEVLLCRGTDNCLRCALQPACGGGTYDFLKSTMTRRCAS
jgi:hypothetical protein